MRLWPKKSKKVTEGTDTAGVVDPQDKTVIGSTWKLKGRISGKGQVVFQNTFEGELKIQGRLTVDAPAALKGTFQADEICVRGSFEGNLEGLRVVSLEATARVNGEVTTPRLKMAGGALLNGTISMEDQRTSLKQ